MHTVTNTAYLKEFAAESACCPHSYPQLLWNRKFVLATFYGPN